jgi:hypothetical protein
MDNATQGPEERRLKRLEETLLVAEAQAGNCDAFVQLMNVTTNRCSIICAASCS